MDKELITLQFQTLQDLNLFKQAVDARNLVTDVANLQLICKCSKENIALAMNSFGAKLVEQAFKS